MISKSPKRSRWDPPSDSTAQNGSCKRKSRWSDDNSKPLTKELFGRFSKIVSENPTFKPPVDYKPSKLQKKLYVPEKKYPDYNFVGLIIGPRGNTHRRMEKETGAKIKIRGKGSIKNRKDLKPHPSDDDELHILVEAESQDSLEAASMMVEKLLKPVEDGSNKHKMQQLRELAYLNGTIRGSDCCTVCGDKDHLQYACPSHTSNFKNDPICKTCGNSGHVKVNCPMEVWKGKKMQDEYKNFLAELGETLSESANKQTLNTRTNSNDFDETNLYVSDFPPTLDNDGLIQLFKDFGDIVDAKVVKDHTTGLSNGYGFVKYSNAQQAKNAILNMSGRRIGGHAITVRIAGKLHQTSIMPTFPSQQHVFEGNSGNTLPSASRSNLINTLCVTSRYDIFPPEPLGSCPYTPVENSHVPTYDMQYRPSIPTNFSSEPQQRFPHRVLSQNVPSVSGKIYSLSGMQSNVRSMFSTASSSGYPSYYLPSRYQPVPSEGKSTYDSEYNRFMAEMNPDTY